MNPLGTQHIAEFIECNKTFLNDPQKLEQIIRNAIEYSGLHFEKIITHKFNPVGVTLLAIISESHIGLHTYPEAGHLSLDVFTCSHPSKQIKLIEYLQKVLKPTSVKIAEITRGNPIEFKQDDWLTSRSEYGFEVKYHIQKILYSNKSSYQFIDVIENEHFGRMLFLDKDLQISEMDAEHYSHAMIDPVLQKKKKLKNVLILGGGDGGLLNFLLKHNPEKVTLVEIDEEVIKVSKKYLKKICGNSFNDKRVNLLIQDALQYLQSTRDKYDVLLYDLTMHPESFIKVEREKFLNDVFYHISRILNPKGIATFQVGSEYDKLTLRLVQKLLKKHFKQVNYSLHFLRSYCERWVFADVLK
ncbi:MAG: adenosylmethionine decarboxylase [Ignavibacteria bacterium]|jgi:spermidine synthase|nr:adenosylmethionine decarboxylase [Ignavibacteria bacterium]MDH7527422.1 adenosylmethionine decarboxylase [Ignavibacteria bacterium]